MQASDALAAMSLQLQQAAQLQLATQAMNPMASAGMGAAPLPGQPITGVVRAWYDEKGFGFIAPEHGGQDVFIHRKQLGEGQSLVQGSRVQYELAMSSSSGKPAASRVTPLGSDGAAMLPQAIPTPSLTAGGSPSLAGKGLGKGPDPSDNLFICGLPLDTNEDKLRKVFNEYGIVTTMRLLPDVAGKPDKSALIRMSDVNQASWMVDNLNGNIPQGLTSPVTVRFADNRAQRARELGLPKPGTPGAAAYGAMRMPGSGAAAAASPYGVGDPAYDEMAAQAAQAAMDPNALFAALAQMQGQSQQAFPMASASAAGLPPAANPGQSLQELLQDLQNLQGLTAATAPSADGLAGLNFIPS